MERESPAAFARFRTGVAVLLLLVAGLSSAQNPTEEQFIEESLRYRTALHYDPLLETPLEALVRLYRTSERIDELIGVYKSHIEQYPEDAGAKTVLVRVLRRVDRSGADELVSAAVLSHPDYAPLQYMLFRFLDERGDARSADALSRAIDLEVNPARRNEWIEQLLQLSEGDAARNLAAAQFERLLAVENQSSDALVELARLMQRYQFWGPSISALNRAKAARPSPETEIEVDLMLATALAQLGNRADAGRILDALHGRLAPDHWRRREIMSLRVGVVASDEERASMLSSYESAYRDNPQNESAVLDYAELLIASERKAEAAEMLVEAANRLPKSRLVEARAMEVLAVLSDHESYAHFLEQRLENEPERIDLRFHLVKLNYAIGKDAAADQDFKAVVAGLPPGEVSGRILDLQRYLRSIDRIDAATPYLERYVRNHPSRLDIARELAEIHVATGSRDAVESLVRLVSAEEAETENILDFAEFLLQNEFYYAAKSLLEAKLAMEPNQFELGLHMIRALGRMGDSAAAVRQVAAVRDLTDTPERYRQWLKASVEAHTQLESLSRFFDSEQNRFNFADGEWSEDKLAKFLALSEVGRQQLFTERVARRIREQLEQPGLEAKLRMRLRAFLVGVIERDPLAAGEVDQQLRLLATEDPGNRLEYELRRALVLHRSQRVDLAQEMLAGIDLTEVSSPSLLREAADTLIDYGFLREADTALAAINRLEPTDLLSWERRLSVLVAMKQESAFRAALRTLRNNEAGIPLREMSLSAIDEHLSSSYWRSISALLSSEESDLGEILPLIASAEREERGADAKLWAEWTRALVLYRLGKGGEASESISRFRALAGSQSLRSLNFPDGLVLSIDAAAEFLTPAKPVPSPEADAPVDFVLGETGLRWAFELPEDSNILHVGHTTGRILILDDRGTVYSIDEATGKLVWRNAYSDSRRGAFLKRPGAFDEVPAPPPLHLRTGEKDLSGKAPRSFAVSDGRFFLATGNHFGAYSAADGESIWTAVTSAEADANPSRDLPAGQADIVFAVEGEFAVVFDRARETLSCHLSGTGKLHWELDLSGGGEGREGRVHSLNSGLSVQGGHAFVYGSDSAIVDVASGKAVWQLDGRQTATFPIVLRMQREEEAETGSSAESAISAGISKNGIRTELFDLQSGMIGGLLGKTASLVAPAVYWARERLAKEEASYASVSDGYLWLMQDGRVRRISIQLPVAAVELPGTGTFLGQTGGHAWFLDGEALHHLDFVRERSSILSLRDLGDSAKLRAVMSGKQLLVRGENSFKVFNALSGEALGRGNLPSALQDFLSSSLPVDLGGSEVRPVWQGRLHRRAAGEPGYCFPVSDLISGNRYYTSFARRVLVCLGPSEQLPRMPLPPSPRNR